MNGQYLYLKELMDQKILAELRIKCLVLKYSEESCKIVKGFSYQEEIDYIVSNKARNEFIRNLAVSLHIDSYFAQIKSLKSFILLDNYQYAMRQQDSYFAQIKSLKSFILLDFL